MGFQTVMRSDPAPAVKGDFASANPRANVLAGEGAMLAADIARALIVGNFGWFVEADATAYGRYYGEVGARIGFLRRDQQANLQTYLADSQMYVLRGLQVTLFDQGEFWAEFVDGAEFGQKVFANYLDGSTYADDAGASTETATFTGALASTGILTATSVTGTLSVGDVVTSAGITGLSILAQLSGTAGGAGTYLTSKTGSTVAAEAATAHNAVETDYVVTSPADAGELAKISTWAEPAA